MPSKAGLKRELQFLKGKHELEQSIISDDGSVANRNIELAQILGITESRAEISPQFLANPAGKDEIVRWVENARKLARKNRSNDSSDTTDIETRAGFLRYAAESFFGAAEIRRKLSTRDLGYYMDNLKDGNAVPEAGSLRADLSRAERAVASQCRQYDPSGRMPILRSDALFLLLNWIESVRPDILSKGTFVTAKTERDESYSNAAIQREAGETNAGIAALRKAVLCSGWMSGRAIPVSSIKILGNEKLSFYAGPSGTMIFLEVELNPNGASSDRYSPAANWDVTLARSAVAEKLRNLTGNIGQFQRYGTLTPGELGQSGAGSGHRQPQFGRSQRIQSQKRTGSQRHAVHTDPRIQSGRQRRQLYFPWARIRSRRRIVPGRGIRHGAGRPQL